MALSNASYLLPLVFLSLSLKGQDYSIEDLLTDQVATVEESNDEDIVNQQLILHDLLRLNINEATVTELSSMPSLTPDQVQSLVWYIQQNGPLVSKYELQAVPGWDLVTIRSIEPLITIIERNIYHDPRVLGKRITDQSRAEFTIRVKKRLEPAKGYLSTDYNSFSGSPIYFHSRFQYRKKGDLSFGIITENDPGEKFQWNMAARHYGTDYLSAHLQLENKGPLKRLILGDFRAQWDQGLVLNSGLSLGRQVLSGPRKIHRGILPYTGTRETNNFRGIGIEIVTGKTTIGMLYSNRSLDARVVSEDTVLGLPKRFSSILETGLHRTITEIARRQVVPEQIVGLHFRTATSRQLSYSISGVYRQWKLPLIRTASLQNMFKFRGRVNYNVSSSIEYVWKNINTFGQVAFSKSGGLSGLMGLIGSFSPTVSMALHLRSYGKNYHGISSNAFGTSSDNQNEQGIYWGIQIAPNKRWLTEFYTNIYRFPWITNSADAVALGMEQQVRVEFTPNKKSWVRLHWRTRRREVNRTPINNKSTHDIVPEVKHNLGLAAAWQGNGRIALKAKLQYSTANISTVRSMGILVNNQLSYVRDFLKFTISMAIFSTDNFENRQYIFEKDLPNSLSIPFFDGHGFRWYCITSIRVRNNCSFWLRIARTTYHDKTFIGNGSDRIDGSKKTDISLQVRYKL